MELEWSVAHQSIMLAVVMLLVLVLAQKVNQELVHARNLCHSNHSLKERHHNNVVHFVISS